jgi:hypothetical protein
MAKYKVVVIQRYLLDNYLLYLKGLGTASSKAFNAQGDVSEPYIKMTEPAIPDPA